MKKIMFAAICTALAAGSGFAADAQVDPAKVFADELKSTSHEFLSLVEAMPADKFSFAPTNGAFKGVRTFADQVKHVAAVTYVVAAGIKGEKPPVDTGGESGPKSIQTKEQILKYATDAFEYAKGAVATLTAANVLEEIPSPFGEGKSSRLDLASTLSWHAFDHYGQMVVYVRMNGIVPPASR